MWCYNFILNHLQDYEADQDRLIFGQKHGKNLHLASYPLF